ncbi:MAG: GAF domain-containing protein [Gammaproteobacteria bacterium]|nr:GAF domain-containing protein [Gammaproteobacteria bacterium]
MRTQALSTPSVAAALAEALLDTVTEIGRARTLDEVTAHVRSAVRSLLGADGATFVLRDGEYCRYVDEDAIAPLWKGQRFPMHQCVSGWVMTQREAVAIADVFKDHRIPVAVYRPTFVKSLAMVPIGAAECGGAIGAYWAQRHHATGTDLWALQALAAAAAGALANIARCDALERDVAALQRGLELANRDLATFASTLTHDLHERLLSVDNRARQIMRDADTGDPAALATQAALIRESVQGMDAQIDATRALHRLSQKPMSVEDVDLSALARETLAHLDANAWPRKHVDCTTADGVTARGDANLLRILLENLLSNAWKYSSKQDVPRIEFGARRADDGTPGFFVRDNGAGIDAHVAGKLFAPFARPLGGSPVAGHGVGLATAERIVQKHGGRLWAESAPGHGATFFFTLPETD